MSNNFEPPSPERYSLPDVKIGDKIIIHYSKGNLNNQTLHVRGFVDGRMILAHWMKRKRYYRYEIQDGIWWHVFSKNCRIVRKREI